MAKNTPKTAPPETPEGMAVIIAPEGCTTCSHDGVAYEVDAEGFVTVAVEAVADLLSHGFTTP